MTATAAMIGYGTTYEVEDAPGSGVFVKLGEVKKVKPPSATTDEVDATHLESPDRTKEFIQGMIDRGEVPLTINWIPGNATDAFLMAWQLSGLNRANRITYPNAVADTFNGFAKNVTPGEITPEGLMTSDVTVRVGGATSRS